MLGAGIPGPVGSYPTTDAALDALYAIADGLRANGPTLARSHGRDAVRSTVTRVFGERLRELRAMGEAKARWRTFRGHLRSGLNRDVRDLTHYVPVWLFARQDCPAFSVGPVRLIEREGGLGVVTERRGARSSWMVAVEEIWAGREPPAMAGSSKVGREPSDADVRAVARSIRPGQWVACAEVRGFEPSESRRRGLLAARVALDTVRLALEWPHRAGLSTAADSVPPTSVDRLKQEDGRDLASGWQGRPPGVGGHTEMARELVAGAAQLFAAAGACIEVASSADPTGQGCPCLADCWFNAVHWFGRACQSDVDFVAVVMTVISLDVLCGGKEDRGIVELVCRLTGAAASDAALSDGTSLRALVERFYKSRSTIAHGSVLAVHGTYDVERRHLEDLAATTLAEYVIVLHDYAAGGGLDNRDAFLDHLAPALP